MDFITNKKISNLIEQNIEFIKKDTIITFNNIFRITIILLGIVSVLSFISPNFYSLRILYNTTFFTTLILFRCFVKTKQYKWILFQSYLLLFIMFGFSLYLAIVTTVDSNASTIIAVLCVTPVIFMDKPIRINTCIILCYLVQCILVFVFKTQALAISDCVNSFVATTMGIYIGNQIRILKLTNYGYLKKFEKERFIDSLTSLQNRNKMTADLIQNSSQTLEVKITGVIMMDIDFFKQYNDTYGHQVGDVCLEKIGLCLNEFGNKHHLNFYRYGGEEFIAFSYGDEFNHLKYLAEKLCQEVENLKIPFKTSEYEVVTISIGFSQNRFNQETEANALVNIADQALYRAKNAGRNCVMPSH